MCEPGGYPVHGLADVAHRADVGPLARDEVEQRTLESLHGCAVVFRKSERKTGQTPTLVLLDFSGGGLGTLERFGRFLESPELHKHPPSVDETRFPVGLEPEHLIDDPQPLLRPPEIEKEKADAY